MTPRALCSKCLVGVALLALACTPRQELPAPSRPFTVTPDEAFRERPPVLESGPELFAFEPQLFELENGMRVIVVERHELPVVAVAFANRAARDEGGTSQVGLSALTLSTIDSGTRMENGETLFDLTVDGRRLRPIASPDGIALETQTLPWGVDEAVSLVARWVRFPALDAAAFSLGRSIEADRMSEQELRLRPYLYLAARERLYGKESFLAQQVFGRRDNLARFTLADVTAFYGRNYQPGTSALIVGGDVVAADVVAVARQAFGTWQASSTPVIVDPSPVVPQRAALEIDAISAPPNQALFVGMLPCPGLTDPDALAGDVLAVLLGQMTLSRTAVRLRHETGSSYAGHATCLQRRNFGELSIEVSSSTDRAGLTLETVLEQLESLGKELVNERELETAKSRVLAEYAGQIARVPELTRTLALQFVIGAPGDFHATLPARARVLDAERLRQVAARFLDVRRFGVAVAGDPASLDRQLDDYAKIRWSYLREAKR